MRKKSSIYSFFATIFAAFYLITFVNAQTPSVNLENTQWITKPFRMVNLDASDTVITSTYYFYQQGKLKLYTLATKGVGISPVDGSLTFPFASDSEVLGTFKVEGKSIYLYFPNETVIATISDNQMKGVSFQNGTNKKEEWLIERFISENNSNNENSLHPNLVRGVNGKLSPANGYQWVNPNDPKDLRVEIKSEFISKNFNLNLNGSWQGTYHCGQGITNLNLVITHDNSSKISAIFIFSSNKNNPSVPSGSFKMAGTYDNKTNKIILNATEWIDQPMGYFAVNLIGSVLKGDNKIIGEIANGSCSGFTIEKK